jgi:hypothetical protein
LDLTLRNPLARYPVARAQPAERQSQKPADQHRGDGHAVRPGGVPAWGMRFVLTFLFSK